MKIQTFSILAGSEACNARCPFCVSKMTPPHGIELKEPEVNWRNFRKACLFARQSGVTTAMITGKGEPTLFPAQVTKYLERMAEFEFPFVELQTNGIHINDKWQQFDHHLARWYELGLTTVIVSIVHFEPERNREVYLPHRDRYIDLPGLIAGLHDKGLSVRLGCVALGGYIDGGERLEEMIHFAREHGVEQLTIRPVNAPEDSRDADTFNWTKDHFLTGQQFESLKNYLKLNGRELMRLVHGAVVYDVRGQNVCLSNCLTIDAEGEEIRQLIFFPDGHLRYDWQYQGAILL
jgi:molybdenum cofactor biosynthesis enzyme MoaA